MLNSGRNDILEGGIIHNMGPNQGQQFGSSQDSNTF